MVVIPNFLMWTFWMKIAYFFFLYTLPSTVSEHSKNTKCCFVSLVLCYVLQYLTQRISSQRKIKGKKLTNKTNVQVQHMCACITTVFSQASVQEAARQIQKVAGCNSIFFFQFQCYIFKQKYIKRTLGLQIETSTQVGKYEQKNPHVYHCFQKTATFRFRLHSKKLYRKSVVKASCTISISVWP